MKSINNGPGKKQDIHQPANEQAAAKKGVYANKDRSKNYKYGADNVNGPDFDKEGKLDDGDTSVNAGIFK